MRIESKEVAELVRSSIEQVRGARMGTAETGGVAGVAAAAGSDEAVLSPRAAELQKAYHTAMQSAAMRQDKVADLKQQIEAGAYEVDAETIAEAVIRGGI